MNEEETIIRNLEDKVSKIRDEHREVVKDLVRTHKHLQISQGELVETKTRLDEAIGLLKECKEIHLTPNTFDDERMEAKINNFLNEEE